MELFKMFVIHNLPKVYNKVKSDSEEFGRVHFVRMMAEVLGYIPADWEVEGVYKSTTNLTCTDMKNIVSEKLEYIHIKQYLHIAFLKLDKGHKGFITLEDLKKSFDEFDLCNESSWARLKENFIEISNNGIIHLNDFISILSIKGQ